MSSQIDPKILEDVQEAIYDETDEIIDQAEEEGMEYPYTLALHQDCPGDPLVSICATESEESIALWDLTAIDASALEQPFTITLWAHGDQFAKLSRTFRVADHYAESARNEDGDDMNTNTDR